MPTLKKLPAKLKACVYALSQLRTALERFEAQLVQAGDMVLACDAVPKKALAPVAQHLDAAVAELRRMVSARGEEAQTLALEHFAKLGIAPGASLVLRYPLYGSRLDAAFDEDKLPRRIAQATLKVEGFTVEHVRGRGEVVLGVSGRVLVQGKPAGERTSFCLHPGCGFEILKPAPARAASDAAAPAPTPGPASAEA
jgi:hypothetical protein